MKQITFFFAFIFFSTIILNAQTIKIAILDFENTSGIAKYDGLGKAMSSMLITDIEANVSPKRLQLVERAQIQKILKEQNFQASSAVDKSSSVKAGKLLGVKYLLVGDIYILNDVLVINARLTDTETGDIKFSKKQEGKLVGWLNLKTNIAKDLATSISMPFTEPNIPDKEINVAVITNFGNAITSKDNGDIKKAEELLNTVRDFSPDFKYLDDLKAELDVLKKQVEKNTEDIKNLNQDVTESIENPYSLALTKLNEKNYEQALKYFKLSLSKVSDEDEFSSNKKCFNYMLISECKNGLNKPNEAIQFCDSALLIYPNFFHAYFTKLNVLLKNKRISEADIVKNKIINTWEENWTDRGIVKSDWIKKYKNLKFESDLIIDGYDKVQDLSITSRRDLLGMITQVYEDNNTKIDLEELEYLRLRTELLKMNSDLNLVLPDNFDWIEEYFSLINSVAWNKIKQKKYEEAQQLLVEHIILLANLSWEKAQAGNKKYCLPEKKDNFRTMNPFEVAGYLLGNLANTYIGLNQPEKAKIIYSALNYDFLRICGYKINIEVYNKKTTDNINFCNLFEQDIKDLGFKNIIINDFKNYILKDEFIFLDSFGDRKLTIKKSNEGEPYYLKSY